MKKRLVGIVSEGLVTPEDRVDLRSLIEEKNKNKELHIQCNREIAKITIEFKED